MPPTQVMQQYLDAKAQAPDGLLLFRMGDFYELFYEDAERAARLLGIALTARDKGENPVPMAGFPYHALDAHLRKLLEAGQRVAICEQVEDAPAAKGIIRRELTRIVTPGTVTDETLLDPRRHNFLAAIAWTSASRQAGIAWADLSSHQLFLAAAPLSAIAEELSRLEPTEILVPDDQSVPADWLPPLKPPALTKRPAAGFARAAALAKLHEHFRVATLGGFGVDDESPAATAAGALLAYLMETQRTNLSHIDRLTPYDRGLVMLLDPTTRRSLEISRSMRDNRRAGTLLDTLDRTVTSAGARRLDDWLNQPLVDVAAIQARHAAVGEWKDDPVARGRIRELLRHTYDVERLAARVSTGRTNPRDLGALRDTLRLLPELKAKLAGRIAKFNADVEEGVDLFPDLRQRLETTLVDDPPLHHRDGGVIRAGFHGELDEIREAAHGGKQWMAAYQRQESERIGVPNLKIGFNRVFGYYVEIPNSGRSRAPAEYIRRQTVKNAERYITPELKEYERKVLGGEERANQLEGELFRELREATAKQTSPLHRLADQLAKLDCATALAEVAAARDYVRPQIVDGDELNIEAGRHPVLDAILPAGRLVPNDVRLGSSTAGDRDPRFLLITGPNMAGKSTYIRQAALLALMAQAGSFVPAGSAVVGVVDRIFTRVGASDELSRGQSTFMVEMAETANILHNATRRSLVILDEIGRGTSTYDGVSLAWAIAEHLHEKIGCRTLFATHYHELIDLEKTLDRLRNCNIAVREWKDEIVFLHQIVDGGADRSYGIHVARLAGVPGSVLERAQHVLDRLERDPFDQQPTEVSRPKKHRRQYHQLRLFTASPGQAVAEALRQTDAESISPEEALTLLRRLRLEAMRQE